MDFLKELAEARMTRSTSRTERLTYRDCCERAYLVLLILELLRKYPRFSPVARQYAKDTVKYTGFDYFRMSSTDLYNFLYFIVGDDEALSKLRDPIDAKKVREKTHLPTMAVNRYLTKISHGSTPENVASLFIKLESVLYINNASYKSIRRTVINLERTSDGDIKKAVTKLLYAARAKLRSADIIDPLERLANVRGLESPAVPDRETVITKPDMVVKDSDLMYLQRLVGAKNLYLAVKYIELSSQGKTIPSHLVQAFNPALEVLVDIIKGGPAYLQTLKRLQRSAKKAQRRR